MNILYINTGNLGGGAEKVAIQIYNEFSKREGFKCYFLCAQGDKLDKNNYIILKSRILRKLFFRMSKRWNNQPVSVKCSLWIIKYIILKYKIDIVHLHNVHGNYLGIEDVEEIAKMCRVVWTLHDMWTMTGHCAYSIDCDSWMYNECACCDYKEIYPSIKKDDSHAKYLLKKASFCNKAIDYVVPSRWLKSKLEKSYLKDEKISIVHNGIDYNEFQEYDKALMRNKYGVSTEKKVLLFGAANVNNIFKGIDYLYNALECVKKKDEYVLLCIGKGLDKSRISAEYELIEYGYVKDAKKINEIFSMADLFLMTSVADNFPGVVLESMASGTPVLSFATGGICEQITEDVGWLIKTGDYVAFGECIENIFEDKIALYNKAMNCREHVISKYSQDKMLKSYERIYKREKV